MDGEQLKILDDRYILHTYARAPFVLERGEGFYVYDTEGKGYLDFVSGIAVNALGHGDPGLLAAIVSQANRLMHVSNLYLTAPQVRLAKMLVDASFADKVFFCNSGTEAAEAAIKFARKWAYQRKGGSSGGADKTEILAFSNAFHGRTMGALSLTPRAQYQDPFRPLMPGAKFATYNDLASADALLDERTCACIVEPVQGEGGVHPADPAFLQGLRRLCDEREVLLIFDEIQCGLGRTGALWAHTPYGITPDILTLAKPLGGGLPIGATLVTQAVADAITPGDHGSTFAANPVVCAAAEAVLSRILAPGFLAQVQSMGGYLKARLEELKARHSVIEEVRGIGMIWGIATAVDVDPLVNKCYAKGLLACKAGSRVLRLLPPLVVGQAQIDEAVSILEDVFNEL